MCRPRIAAKAVSFFFFFFFKIVTVPFNRYVVVIYVFLPVYSACYSYDTGIVRCLPISGTYSHGVRANTSVFLIHKLPVCRFPWRGILYISVLILVF